MAKRIGTKKSFILILIGLYVLLSGFSFDQRRSQRRIDRINLEIKLQGLKWEAGETSISKLPLEQRRMRLGDFIPSGEDPSGYVKIKKREVLPMSLDWRSKDGKNYMTSMKEQGNCGSCWAFATLATIEAIYNVENDIYSTQPLKFPDLSEQDLISCSKAGDCAGGSPSSALDHVKNNGIVSEDCFPYIEEDAPCALCTEWDKKLARIKGWGWITQTFEDRDTIKTALQDGPLKFRMDVYSDYYYYKSGVYKPIATASYEGSHGVMLVGYDEEEDCWICKNSWGTDWGKDGYFKIKMGECGTGSWVLKVWGVSINNKQPVLNGIEDKTVKEGQTLSFRIEASDPDNDILIYIASSLPSGAALDRKTGLFQWTPSYVQSGVYRIEFIVSDGVFESSQEAKITVINVKKGKGKH